MILISWVAFRVASYFPLDAQADPVSKPAATLPRPAPQPVVDELLASTRSPSPSVALSLSDGVGGSVNAQQKHRGGGKANLPSQMTPSALAGQTEIAEHRPAIAAPMTTHSEPPAANRPIRLSQNISAWMIWRRASEEQLATAGQLGGSQAGIRATVPIFTISPRTRVGGTARLSAPLESRVGREAALGLSLRRGGTVPAELILERRIALSRGPDRFAVIGATGISDFKLGSGMLVNGYAQAGIVGFRQPQTFVDGSITVEHPVAKKTSVGIGVWGAAQPGVARLDAGPQLTIKVPANTTPIRIAASWRFRLAGHAAPRSGPAITVGTDF